MSSEQEQMARWVRRELCRNFAMIYAYCRSVARDEEDAVPPPRTADEALRHKLVARVLGDWQRQWRKAGR